MEKDTQGSLQWHQIKKKQKRLERIKKKQISIEAHEVYCIKKGKQITKMENEEIKGTDIFKEEKKSD